MDLIQSLNNTEKKLDIAGEYCVAFDLMANTRKEVSASRVKDGVSKTMAFYLFKVSPIAFALTLVLKLIFH